MAGSASVRQPNCGIDPAALPCHDRAGVALERFESRLLARMDPEADDADVVFGHAGLPLRQTSSPKSERAPVSRRPL